MSAAFPVPFVRPLAKAACLALAVSSAGCSALCGGAEEQAVSAGTDPALTLDRGAGAPPVQVQLQGRITPSELGRADFDAVFGSLGEGRGASAVAVSLGGEDPATHEQVALTLVLPSPMHEGDTYPITSTLRIAPNPGAAAVWGARTPPAGGGAAVALSTFTYTFPPAAYHVQFQAATATGSARVLDRYRGVGFSLGIDLVGTDDAGRAIHVQGRVTAVTERYTPPCT
ncbi:MAG: hypothetical protein JWM27_3499 [Gemmatimonadetes bacterium]|nr:hypothetical protein [Gemmatimonadota bacterium]